ncbi:hypothetical protein Leryth_003375 [Lithospermum erythrorhizon]|nr:hypothetical protein Leryth_003375 [Lithospermum erythrorhizon]
MGPAWFSNSFSLLFLILSLYTILSFSADQTNMVFKGCANQKFQDPTGAYSQTLDSLYDTLIAQSATSKFYKTTSGQGQTAIFGLFQCRARVQLGGCYMRYEVSGFKEVSGTELLYKICGSTQASGAGFGDRLDTALGEIVKGVGNGNGYYAGGYESVYVLGQCEGDLGSNDCVQCVKNAIQNAKSECGYSISAQIYLQDCYISYSYYPNGVPRKSVSSGTKQNTQRTIAMLSRRRANPSSTHIMDKP